MAHSKIISKQSYKRATWKNGLGHTDEIAIHPEGAELRKADFLWRLSSARIEQAAPFSAFPEHDRILVVLKGAGVQLTHNFEGDEESVDVPLLSPYEFPGDVPSRCALKAGPITDLSVFVRKAEVEAVADVADVTEEEAFEWLPMGRWNFVFAAQGSFEVHSPEGRSSLAEGDTLQLDLEEPLPEDQPIQICSTAPAGRLVIISLQG